MKKIVVATANAMRVLTTGAVDDDVGRRCVGEMGMRNAPQCAGR